MDDLSAKGYLDFKTVAELYDFLDDVPLMADNELKLMSKAIKALTAQIAPIAQEKEELKNRVAQRLLDKVYVIEEDGSLLIEWKRDEDKTVFDIERFKTENKDLYTRYLTNQRGRRVMRFK